MRYLSLCSGIEAATVAWHPMGWEPAAFAEIEAFPAAVLKHHYPNTPNLGDMTKWREWNVGAIDLLVGGTPCQSFSVAGLRKGLSDPRGGLMLTFLEIAQSLRPRWVVWENVPGVLSSAGGRDFGSFLGALGELGYGWAYRVLDAQWCRVDGYERAVPQRRRRVFVVGCLGDATRAAKVLFEQQSVERNPAPRGKARQGAAADAEDGVETGGWMPNNPGVVSSVCAKWAKKTGGPSGSEHFNLTMEPAAKWPAEVCSTLNASFGEKQGLEDQHALGGAQCFVPVLHPVVACTDTASALTASGRGVERTGESRGQDPLVIARGPNAVAVPIQDGREIAKAQNDLGIGGEGDPSYTLDQTGAQAVAIQGNLIGRDVGGPQGVGASTDGAMYTLTKADIHGVAVPFRKSHRAASATDDESWVRAETANTLNRFDTGERDTHAICHLCDHAHEEDRICQECGNDLACDTLDLCSDCLHEQAQKQSLQHAIAFEPRYYTRDNKTGGAPQDVPSLRADASKVGDTSPCVAFTIGNLSRGAGPSPNSEVAPTQKCSAGRGADDQRTCVAFTCKDHGADAGDVAPTLRAMPHDGSHPNGGGQVAVAVSFDWQKGNDVGNPRPSTMNIAEEHSQTLGTTRVPAVAHGFYSTGGTHGVNMEPEVSPAVKVGSGLGIPSPPAVAFKPSHFMRGKDGSPADITPPLSADADKGDQDTVVAYPIDSMNHIARGDDHSFGDFEENGPSYTLTKGHSHAVAAIAPSLTASNDPSRSPQSAEVTQQIAAVHQATMVVRRLTPVECERLQGFPDDYTNIPWRGKPESPDGPRYKALGNSMAVNCMRWIGRRIDAVEKGTELPA